MRSRSNLLGYMTGRVGGKFAKIFPVPAAVSLAVWFRGICSDNYIPADALRFCFFLEGGDEFPFAIEDEHGEVFGKVPPRHFEIFQFRLCGKNEVTGRFIGRFQAALKF